MLNGSTLILANDKEQKTPFSLGQIILKNKVNMFFSTPSKMRAIIENTNYKDFIHCLQQIMLGGEELDTKLFRRLKTYTKAKIYNAYGPTEVTITTSVKELTNTNKITIGTPLGNLKMFILDKFLNPVPIGIIGELYVSGDGLARGYLNDSILNKEKFLVCPHIDSGFLYKTGDLVKWLAKGEVEFIGRKDTQVKLNGYRIELDEIENVILSYDGIIDTAVITRKNKLSRSFLCSYYVSDRDISLEELKMYLYNRLPVYMVPKLFKRISAIPLTYNVKKTLEAF